MVLRDLYRFEQDSETFPGALQKTNNIKIYNHHGDCRSWFVLYTVKVAAHDVSTFKFEVHDVGTFRQIAMRFSSFK